MDFLCDERQFVSSFLKMSRECYGRLLFLNSTSTLNTKHLSDASVTHSVGGFVEEVKQFVCNKFPCSWEAGCFLL